MKRIASPLLATVLAVGLIGLLVFGLRTRADNHSLETAAAHGLRPVAPDRSLPRLGAPGQSTLAAYRGHVVVLNFWASWCEPCRAEAPMLERAQPELARHGATVLGVTYRDTTPDAVSFERRYGLTYPSLRDVDGKLADAYGTRALPETFVIDPRGRVASLSRGEVSPAFLARAVALAQTS